MKSKIFIGLIEFWLNTTMGSIYGNPMWGNNFNRLLFKNENMIDLSIGLILDKMYLDLGEVAMFVTGVTVSVIDGETNIIKINILGGYELYVKA